jgi:alpha-beta hydrolase superfamily lysophospholipase
VRTFPPDRPTRTILRPAELASARPAPNAKEVVLLISGINSYPQDPTFDALVRKLLADPRYEVHRFGADPQFPYDALGGLDGNARSLTDQVRALGATHPAVHLVAHSMGGAVVDRALATGLSAGDGAATYIALAAPHSGSATLAAARPILAAAGDESLEVRALVSPKLDIGSDAARDLAHTVPAGSRPGITRLDLRMSTDWTVTARDAADPGVESRTLTPTGIDAVLDGHGAVTRDARVIDLVTSTIATRAVPADIRGAEVRASADWQSDVALAAATCLAAVGCLLALGVAFGLRFSPAIRWITRPLAVAQLENVRRK